MLLTRAEEVAMSAVSARGAGVDALALEDAWASRCLAAMIDPFVVLRPVKDAFGSIVDFVYEYLNGAAVDFYGLPAEALVGQSVAATVPNFAESGLLEVMAKVAETGESASLEHFRFDGGDLSGRYDIRVHKSGDLIANCWRDVTETEREHATIRLQARLLDEVGAAVVASDPGFVIESWNKGAERLFGWTSEEALGKTTTELLSPWVDHEVILAQRPLKNAVYENELELARKDGSRVWVLNRTLPRVEDGEITGYLGVSVDLTTMRAAERELRETRDFLAALTDSMGEGMYALDCSGCVTYANPVAARLLGWEQCDLIGKPMHDLARFEQMDGTPYPVDECPLPVTCGAPVQEARAALIRRDGTRMPVSFTATALHTRGRVNGCVVVFRDVSEAAAEEVRVQQQLDKLAWIGRIQDALAEDRFVLYAQPIVDLSTDAVVQHELLLRMVSRDGEVILPDRFLPTAEEFGLIGRIDRWVVNEAAKLAAAGHHVEFNISARSVGDPAMLRAVTEAITTSGAPAEHLVCEITETALVETLDAGEALVRALSRLGCDVALDDFGAGYGGFAYLKRLPVSFLKIDIEFVRDALVDEASRHVISAIVNLARAFNLRTVAEGAESPEMIPLLRTLGVDYVQGFGVGRPLPLGEALPRLDGPARSAPPPLRRGDVRA